jgi:hypothetical protein
MFKNDKAILVIDDDTDIEMMLQFKKVCCNRNAEF